MRETSKQYQLAPPGAGLPWLELQIVRGIFHVSARLSNHAHASQMFAEEELLIVDVMDQFNEREGEQEVLIKRLRGLEDSSRYWSAYMTLSHVAIVNRAVVQIIHSLLDGKVPATAARIADVKPVPIGKEALSTFREVNASFTDISRSVKNLRTPLTFAHPWFGELDGARWHFLAGFHMRLHREQLNAILAHVRVNRDFRSR